MCVGFFSCEDYDKSYFCIVYCFFFANSITNGAHIFTGLLEYTYVWINHVRILVVAFQCLVDERVVMWKLSPIFHAYYLLSSEMFKLKYVGRHREAAVLSAQFAFFVNILKVPRSQCHGHHDFILGMDDRSLFRHVISQDISLVQGYSVIQ